MWVILLLPWFCNSSTVFFNKVRAIPRFNCSGGVSCEENPVFVTKRHCVYSSRFVVLFCQILYPTSMNSNACTIHLLAHGSVFVLSWSYCVKINPSRRITANQKWKRWKEMHHGDFLGKGQRFLQRVHTAAWNLNCASIDVVSASQTRIIFPIEADASKPSWGENAPHVISLPEVGSFVVDGL